MSTDNMGIDQQPVSQNADSEYAEYYAMNQEPAAEGTEPGTPVIEVQAAPDVTPPKEEASTPDTKDRVPHWKKQIDKQTRRIRELEEERSQLLKTREKVVAEPKYTADNFVSDAEYRVYEAKRLAREASIEANLELQDQRISNLSNQTNDAEFKASWSEKMASNFEGDPGGADAFRKELSSTTVQLHPDVHSYVEATEYGPRMLQVLLLRPDIVSQINKSTPVVRSALLLKLDREIERHMSGLASAAPAPAQRKVTSAPTPLAPVGQGGGSTLTDEESDEVARARYDKRHFGR
jgi:hypothetical protein